ncbi:MAG: hypothetical protein U0361_02145 [Nitrospiraceae bacterium]
MILATLFVTFPFMVWELLPLLQTIGTEEEKPRARSALKRMAGVRQSDLSLGASVGIGVWSHLTAARAIGEFGAVLVVSGNIPADADRRPSTSIKVMSTLIGCCGECRRPDTLGRLILDSGAVGDCQGEGGRGRGGSGSLIAMKIEVRNLTKMFGAALAVEDVSFDVREGELLGLLGPQRQP